MAITRWRRRPATGCITCGRWPVPSGAWRSMKILNTRGWRMTSRREFIVGAGVAALTAALPVDRLAAAFAPRLYPPIDLSYFDTPITPAPSDIRFGYAAITWGGNDRQAIEDVAAAGFRGIQLRTSVLKEFGDKPAALKELLEQHRLVMTAFSSGNVSIDPAQESKTIDE